MTAVRAALATLLPAGAAFSLQRAECAVSARLALTFAAAPLTPADEAALLNATARGAAAALMAAGAPVAVDDVEAALDGGARRARVLLLDAVRAVALTLHGAATPAAAALQASALAAAIASSGLAAQLALAGVPLSSSAAAAVALAAPPAISARLRLDIAAADASLAVLAATLTPSAMATALSAANVSFAAVSVAVNAAPAIAPPPPPIGSAAKGLSTRQSATLGGVLGGTLGLGLIGAACAYHARRVAQPGAATSATAFKLADSDAAAGSSAEDCAGDGGQLRAAQLAAGSRAQQLLRRGAPARDVR